MFEKAEIEVSEGVKLKVGTLEVDISAAGIGTVRIDGQSLKCRRLSVEMEVGRLPKIVAEFIPLPSSGKETTAVGDQYRSGQR